ncbi:SMU1112c/YaeR family gloxylase I-like metalloprotein [Exiguobacterium aurantiacum]|uniref:Putative lyase n=1 Tax=Exiguobacterium aurantiacum TaxID=33987 RepID=A0A377FXM3_9BACL|nr:VOC family protein [Exiguobacterium aurantiacum]STO09581.1 putative lyase [Exiguobacterium aurantiacum]
MKLHTIHHVAIIATNYEQAKRFYVDILGFDVIREHHRPDKGDHKIDLHLGANELELFIKPDSPKRPSFPEACGLRHLAFKVDDIEAVVAELSAHGVTTEPIRRDTFTGEKMTFFFDPDGLPLELHE